MAFQTGTATNLDDLIDKLRLFLSAQGWTIDKWVAPTGGFDAELYVHKGNVYVSMSTNELTTTQTYHSVLQLIQRPYLYLYLNTGFNGANLVYQQPGFNTGATSFPAYSNWLLGPMTAYYFFEDDTYCHIVVETIPGEYVHFGFGEVEKLGTYNWGTYVYGTDWQQGSSTIDSPISSQHVTPFAGGLGESTTLCSKIMHDIEGANVLYRFSSSAGTLRAIGPGRFGQAEDVTQIGPNDFNGLTALGMPWVHTIAASSLFRPVGQLKDMRPINVQAFTPGQTISIGGDTWYIFPLVTKKDPTITDDLPNSGWYGWAFRQVTT